MPKQTQQPPLSTSISHSEIEADTDRDPDFLRLEQDVLMNICGEQHVFVYQTRDFWLQIKSAGMIVKTSELLLSLVRKDNPEQLSKNSTEGYKIVGDVLVHPTAKIDPTAKLGPNVTIGANVRIGAGVRILHTIILDNVVVKDRSFIIHSIVGWDSIIGEWCRLEGQPDFENPEVKVGCGMTILGTGVKVNSEVVVRSSIVLPHKELDRNYSNQILL